MSGVVVLGMHRSGTSLTTNLLHDLGYHVENTVKPDQYNARGYWEDHAMVEVNDAILAKLGSNGRYVPTIGEGWEREARFRAFLPRLRGLIMELERYDRWVCKDPNLCITLPLWKQFLPESTQYILCLRNPLAIAESMKQRDRLPLVRGFNLWATYTAHALVNTLREARFLISYEGYFSDFASQLRRLQAFVNAQVPSSTRGTLLGSLRHHSPTLEALLDHPRAPPDVKWLYADLIKAEKNPALLEEITHKCALQLQEGGSLVRALTRARGRAELVGTSVYRTVKDRNRSTTTR